MIAAHGFKDAVSGAVDRDARLVDLLHHPDLCGNLARIFQIPADVGDPTLLGVLFFQKGHKEDRIVSIGGDIDAQGSLVGDVEKTGRPHHIGGVEQQDTVEIIGCQRGADLADAPAIVGFVKLDAAQR